jgi:hypothetical protein
MTTVADLLASYASTTNPTKRLQIVEEMGDYLPDPVALDFLIGIVETPPQSEKAQFRVPAIQALGGYSSGPEHEQQRVVMLLTDLVRYSSSDVERGYALMATRRWVHTDQVGSLLHDLIVNQTCRELRSMAMNCLSAIKPDNVPEYAITLCKRMLDDPELGGSARFYLNRWSPEKRDPPR